MVLLKKKKKVEHTHIEKYNYGMIKYLVVCHLSTEVNEY